MVAATVPARMQTTTAGLWLLFSLLLVSLTSASAAVVVKSSKARLPASFVSVLGDLEKAAGSRPKPKAKPTPKEEETAATAEEEIKEEEEEEAVVEGEEDDVEEIDISVEDEADKEEATVQAVADTEEPAPEPTPEYSVAAACLLTSRTVTRRERSQVRQALLPLENDNTEDDADVKAIGCYTTDEDDDAEKRVVCLAVPETLAEVAACVTAVQGNVVYVPSSVDLARGEGLWETLAPAMEQVLKSGSGSTSAKLTVIVPDVASAQELLVSAAEPILANLVAPPSSGSSEEEELTTMTLATVFPGGVEFVTPDEAASIVWDTEEEAKVVTDASALAEAAQGWPSSSSTASTPADWVAAGTLRVQAQRIVETCLESLENAVTHETADGEEEVKLEPAFGELCTAEVHSATSQFDHACGKKLGSGTVVQEIKAQMLDELRTGLLDLQWQQLGMQYHESLREWNVQFAKLQPTVGSNPHWSQAVRQAAKTVISQFAKAAKGLVTSDNALVGPAISELTRTVQEQAEARIQEATASGAFKPLPRKGVTVGLHWLLPKPFGNDYRQEPWNVHATDNLVYVPPGKALSDVSPEDVTSGSDWRSQIVPSPVGNDLIYTQQ